MKLQHLALALALALNATAIATAQQCPAYESHAARRNPPFSPGRHAYPLQRPPPPCRTYVVPEVEQTLHRARSSIGDKDLYRLFVNAWPNTVDTTVLWRGTSADDAEEQLAFITTGDIHAMWLRDSANQLQSYKRLLSPRNNTNTSSIAALYRGAINLQARYIRQFPHCNAFQPPPESKLRPAAAAAAKRHLLAKRADVVSPPYDPAVVFECKYELDSLAAFLQLSWDYYDATDDAAFFARFHWAAAVRSILRLARDMMQGTYADDGTLNPSPYTWLRDATSATETVSNKGAGNPVAGGLGLVRSFFRPSDDSAIYQYLVPSNMMFSRFLAACAVIMGPIDAGLAAEMEAMADGIATGIQRHAVVHHPRYGHVYAFEVDGFGSSNLMDDANIPSLLSIPHLGFKPSSDPLYRRTRELVLSPSNPYFGRGPVLNATGGPHLGPGMAWPMAVIMQTMTSDDDDEIIGGIKQLMGSTSGLGLIHESVNTHDDSKWTRSWFAWANGLFGQMILDLLDRKPQLLSRSFQH